MGETHFTNISTGTLSAGTTKLSQLTVAGSISALTNLNVRLKYVDLATGDDEYTVSGIASGDIILGSGQYVRFSAGAVQTAGAATFTVNSDTTVSVSGCVSTALGSFIYLDISA